MRMDEYIRAYDDLAAEGELFRIPLRKEFILKSIGPGQARARRGLSGWTDHAADPRAAQRSRRASRPIPRPPRSRAHAGIEVTVANVEDGIPFRAASFDAVSAAEIVEHLYDTKSFSKKSRAFSSRAGFSFSRRRISTASKTASASRAAAISE